MTHYDTLLLTMTAPTCVLAASLLIGFLFCYSIAVLVQSVGGMLSCQLLLRACLQMFCPSFKITTCWEFLSPTLPQLLEKVLDCNVHVHTLLSQFVWLSSLFYVVLQHSVLMYE